MAEESRHVADRFCLKCSYPLDHLDQQRCPECGRGFDPSDPATYATSPHRMHCWPIVIAGLTTLCPILLIVAFYGMWASTWLHLRHPPQYGDSIYPPGGDTPFGLLAGAYVFTIVPAAQWNLIVGVYCLYRKRSRACMSLLGVVLLWALPIMMFLWDPFGAWNWFLD